MFSNNLRFFRTVNKMSQSELAERLELKQTSISGLESGRKKPTLETLIKIRNVFHVSLDDLIFKDFMDESRMRTMIKDFKTKAKK